MPITPAHAQYLKMCAKKSRERNQKEYDQRRINRLLKLSRSRHGNYQKADKKA